MLRREPKSLPSTAFIVSIAGSSGLALGGAGLPAMITVCIDARPVEQVDLRPGRGVTAAMFFRGHVARPPAGEEPLEPGLDLGHRGGAHHDERGVVGLEPGLVELDQVVARDLRGRCLGARPGPGIGIGVSFTVDDPREDPERHADRVGLLALDLDQALLPEPLEVGLGEGRMQDDVRVELERGVELLAQRLERHARHVEPGRGAERGAEIGESVADLEGRARGRCPRRACSSPGSPCRAGRTGRPRSRRRAAGRTAPAESTAARPGRS